jgi:hypothetical protein
MEDGIKKKLFCIVIKPDLTSQFKTSRLDFLSSLILKLTTIKIVYM